MYRNFSVVPRVIFGRGCFNQLDDIIKERRITANSYVVFVVDDVFKGKALEGRLPMHDGDYLLFINVDNEPKTQYIDDYVERIKNYKPVTPDCVIGIGGGATMDTAKAISLMLTNPGSSVDYQGWDLIKNPAVYHIGIPTISGTGAEVSRTCILTGPEKKLGINSDYTLFNQMVLDPELVAGVPKEQWFYTGMDCFIHNVESLHGKFLNEFSKAYGEKSQDLCYQIFLEDHEDRDDKLMMASLFGGMSIAYSQVGACHALSYGLSFVLGTHHGIGCSITFDYLEDVYPKGVEEFRKMMQVHKIELPRNLTKGLSDAQMDTMVKVALGLDPLWENCFGSNWKEIMTYDRCMELYKKM